MDESTPHIHAYVVPIDEQGHLNAKRYTGGRDALIRLQTSFVGEMKEFGLKRGMERSNATASDISRYHTYLKQTVSDTLPEPEIGESINDYWNILLLIPSRLLINLSSMYHRFLQNYYRIRLRNP